MNGSVAICLYKLCYALWLAQKGSALRVENVLQYPNDGKSMRVV